MESNTQQEKMYNQIKDEYATTSQKILEILEEIKARKVENKNDDRGKKK